jgi:hypothetical protein
MHPVLGRITEWLGWRYLVLHRVAEQPGDFEAKLSGEKPTAAGTAAHPSHATGISPVGDRSHA